MQPLVNLDPPVSKVAKQPFYCLPRHPPTNAPHPIKCQCVVTGVINKLAAMVPNKNYYLPKRQASVKLSSISEP